MSSQTLYHPESILTPFDIYLWNEGSSFEAWRKMGAHPEDDGTRFVLWAPHADYVAVVGEFNGWNPGAHPMRRCEAGLWEGFVTEARPGQCYKFHVAAPGGYQATKTDPYAFALEPPTSSGNATQGLAAVITDLTTYRWTDAEWMANRKGVSGLNQPMAVYEVHLGSWRRREDGYSLSYREIAEPLADHVQHLGFTHVELLPVMEHPYYGSWGYQVAGFFAPTFRYGSPDDLKYLIDYLHGRGIGVILDWVPAHFAMDPQSLGNFDGQPLYEPEDPRMRTHPDWGTYVFDYGKPGVRNFLVSNAIFWFEEYHIDGIRVDAVASMLYRDYSRSEWVPNQYGGRENLEAIDLLRTVNREVFKRFPEAITVAEESTSWPGVSRPVEHGGLGFLYKWNMGWMHDTIHYMEENPVNRKWHHGSLTFPLVYAWSENYVLPLSHDEVVHLKKSLWGKMPGDEWQKSASLRLMLGHMIGHPGKKLLFMGAELGQRGEWNHDGQVEWGLLDHPLHAGIFNWTQDLFRLYREHPVLWNDAPDGFRWLDADDRDRSIGAYTRMKDGRVLTFIFNFTPLVRQNYRVGVQAGRTYRQVLNSDDLRYGGSGVGNYGDLEPFPVPYQGLSASLVLTLPPLGVIVLEEVEASPEG